MDLSLLHDEIKEWHEKTFPDATLSGQLIKLEEELKELDEAQSVEESLKEMADVYIVCCGLDRWDSKVSEILQLHFITVITEDLVKAIKAKHEKNLKRVWVKTQEGTFHHTNKE